MFMAKRAGLASFMTGLKYANAPAFASTYYARQNQPQTRLSMQLA
jgi:hypothetical protein